MSICRLHLCSISQYVSYFHEYPTFSEPQVNRSTCVLDAWLALYQYYLCRTSALVIQILILCGCKLNKLRFIMYFIYHVFYLWRICSLF